MITKFLVSSLIEVAKTAPAWGKFKVMAVKRNALLRANPNSRWLVSLPLLSDAFLDKEHNYNGVNPENQ